MKKNTVIVFLFLSMMVYAQDPFEGPIRVLDGDNYISVGVAWADYDNDGDQDLYFSNGARNTPFTNYLYQNNGDGTFTKITTGDIVTYNSISGGCGWGDFDNDGLLDLYVAQANDGLTGLPDKIYQNNGDGTFTDVDAGDLTNTSVATATGAWADYNNDGFIDMVTSNVGTFGGPTNHHLFVNNQDSTFSSVSNNLTSGTSELGGIAWADYDNDGDMDVVMVSGNTSESTVLWTNTGSDFTSTVLLTGPDAKAASWGDYDNDGDLDLYITAYGDSQTDPDSNYFFINENGTFIRVTNDTIVNDTDFSYGSAWADYDNDGDLDLFVANDGDTAKSRLYINDGTGHFTRLRNSNIVDSVFFARGCAWADYDNDGDLDLVVGRDGPNYLFKNLGNGNNFINVYLTGVNANKAAIGAIVRVKATINGSAVWQMRQVSTQTGYGSHNSLRLHFGLGDATIVDSLIVIWPGSGNVDEYTDLVVNAFFELTEGSVSFIDEQSGVARDFELLQNYPNPFNPVTRIVYDVPKNSVVRIEIYNILGQKVATPLNEPVTPGRHVLEFNGSSLPSGIYYYKMTAGKFSQTKKMILAK